MVYVVLVFVGLATLYLLGISLGKFAPQVYETWRSDLNGGRENNIPTALVKFVFAMPIAFGVSTLTYGAFAEPRKFLIGLLIGAIATGALAVVVVVGVIVVGCAGWSSCP